MFCLGVAYLIGVWNGVPPVWWISRYHKNAGKSSLLLCLIEEYFEKFKRDTTSLVKNSPKAGITTIAGNLEISPPNFKNWTKETLHYRQQTHPLSNRSKSVWRRVYPLVRIIKHQVAWKMKDHAHGSCILCETDEVLTHFFGVYKPSCHK